MYELGSAQCFYAFGSCSLILQSHMTQDKGNVLALRFGLNSGAQSRVGFACNPWVCLLPPHHIINSITTLLPRLLLASVKILKLPYSINFTPTYRPFCFRIVSIRQRLKYAGFLKS